MARCHMCDEPLAVEDANYCGSCPAWVNDSPPPPRWDHVGFLSLKEATYIVAVIQGEADPPDEDFLDALEERLIHTLTAFLLVRRLEGIECSEVFREFVNDPSSEFSFLGAGGGLSQLLELYQPLVDGLGLQKFEFLNEIHLTHDLEDSSREDRRQLVQFRASGEIPDGEALSNAFVEETDPEKASYADLWWLYRGGHIDREELERQFI